MREYSCCDAPLATGPRGRIRDYGDAAVAWRLAMTAAADRHLLLGLLALQNGIINQGQLVHAFQAWTLDKSKSLAEHLEVRGDLTISKRALLEALCEVHLEAHGGDVGKSLAAVSAGKSTRESLARVGDPEIGATLGHVGSAHGSTEDGDIDRTASYAVGSSTSDGQRFRVLRPHARGGLGAVFIALDSELNREVALKQILDDHADDPVSRQRFLIEAEITGGLEHPGIVPVYGLGTYGDGRPYYAMRFIKGDSLKEAIERFHGDESLKKIAGRRSLELRKLLRRFTDICDAIDYAHSRGVLHRDIKPGNVIVGKHGETLVVDWGLAKATGKHEPGGLERTLLPSAASGSAETVPGSALGTPAYMSPEQACGDLDRLSPRSDVYSLGATLYCLLTGRPPFGGDDIGEVLRKVQHGDFPRPRQLDPSLDLALEAVCKKAMAPNPEDRYASCRALADDVERWAADEPVTAWREPFSRRARRWAKRNRTTVTAAAVALVAGVVGLSAVLAVQTRANAELTRSQAAVLARYDLAVEAIKTFHAGVSEDFLLKQEQFKEVRNRLLKSASDFYGKLGALLNKESGPASRRALWQSNYEVAELTGKVGTPEDALAAHRQVLAARESVAVEFPTDSQIKADVGRSLTAVAILLETIGRTAEAESTYRKAEALLVDLPAPSTQAGAARVVLAQCRSRLGWLLQTTGRNDQALSVYRLARADQEALAATPTATAESRRDLAFTINRVAYLLATTGKSVEAEAEYRKSLMIQQRLVDDNPTITEFRSRLAQSRISFGTALSVTGRLTEGEAEYRKSMAIQQKLAEDNPAVTEFRHELARSHHALGIMLLKTGESSKAEAEYRTALATQQKLADDYPTVTDFRGELALSHSNLGILLEQTGRTSEAEAEKRRALELYQKLSDDNPAVTEFRNALARSHNNLGWLLKQKGKPAEAEAAYREAQALYQKLADDNPAVTEFRQRLALSHGNLSVLLMQTDKSSDAESEIRKALALYQKLADDNPALTKFQRDVANTLDGIGWQLAQSGKTDDAIGYYMREEAVRQKLATASLATPVDRASLANCQTNTADALRRSGRLKEALAACERALAVREPLVEAHPDFPDYRSGLGETYLRLGQVRYDLENLAGAAAAWKQACACYDGIESLISDYTFIRACCHAGLAGLAGRMNSGLSAAEGAVHAEKAMARLRQAVTMGYRNPDAYRTESALDPLRNRPDFQLLMMDLNFPKDPLATVQ